MTVEELRKLQRYIGHSTEEKPNEKIIEHIEKVDKKTPLSDDDWEQLLIPACGNQNVEVLTYLLDRLEKVNDIQGYMKHSVMGQEKREKYLLKRIEILKKLIPYVPEEQKVTVMSETLLSAAWFGETKVVEFLLESGADPYYKNEKGMDLTARAQEFTARFGDDTLEKFVSDYLESLKEKDKNNNEGVFARLKGLFSRRKDSASTEK